MGLVGLYQRRLGGDRTLQKMEVMPGGKAIFGLKISANVQHQVKPVSSLLSLLEGSTTQKIKKLQNFPFAHHK